MKNNMIHFEDLWKIDRYSYRLLYRAFEEGGAVLKKGDKVVLTEWGIQNGIGKRGLKGIVTSNPRKNRFIIVRPIHKKTAGHYWSGFWRAEKHILAK